MKLIQKHIKEINELVVERTLIKIPLKADLFISLRNETDSKTYKGD